jgi:shikimate kinase
MGVVQTPRKIVLTGFMGSGKTTIGRLIGRQLGWTFVDADREIEAVAKLTIAEIFRNHGELWFRQLERDTIARLLEVGEPETTANLVLSLGGGAIEDERTRALLLSDPSIRLIHLEASLETVLLRCKGTESLRPLLQDHEGLASRYRGRLPLYRQAHLNVPVDGIAPASVASMILRQLHLPSEDPNAMGASPGMPSTNPPIAS